MVTETRILELYHGTESDKYELTDEHHVSLVGMMNTREGFIATCRAIITRQDEFFSSEEKNQIIEDVKSFIKKAFLIKKYSEQLAEEYSNVIHSMIKKELVLQRAFLALER